MPFVCPAFPGPYAPMSRLLIVDDNPDYADSLAAALKLRRHEARVCRSGSECLSIVNDFKPDVILVGFTPDAIQVARTVYGQVPVIVITEVVGDLGADGSLFAYRLPKPTNGRELLHLVESNQILFAG
jgi:DNA-binding response OmpR family regulator